MSEIVNLSKEKNNGRFRIYEQTPFSYGVFDTRNGKFLEGCYDGMSRSCAISYAVLMNGIDPKVVKYDE